MVASQWAEHTIKPPSCSAGDLQTSRLYWTDYKKIHSEKGTVCSAASPGRKPGWEPSSNMRLGAWTRRAEPRRRRQPTGQSAASSA